MRRFNHPNIAKIYEVWASNDLDTVHISMEFVPGRLRIMMKDMTDKNERRKYALLYMY